MGKKPTLQTIADTLGISRTTVSNAYNRPDQLSPELRERILETCCELGYTGPDPAARALRSGETHVLGVLLTASVEYALEDPYAISLLRALAAETQGTGIGLLLIPFPPGTEGAVGIQRAAVDGLLAFAMPDGHAVVDAMRERGLPTVIVDGPVVEDMSFVGIDDYRAMGDSVRHLLGHGHERIGVLSYRLRVDSHPGPVDLERLSETPYRTSRLRIEGAVDTIRDAGQRPAFVHELARNNRVVARETARGLLASDDRPTGIVCLSDPIAAGVLDAAADLGIAVPGDLSVVGFDDSPIAEPAGLTTIRQSAREKAHAAWDLLSNERVEHLTLEHSLIQRTSSGPAPR